MDFWVEAVVTKNGNRSRVGAFQSYFQARAWAKENRNDGNWQWKICPTMRAADGLRRLYSWLRGAIRRR